MKKITLEVSPELKAAWPSFQGAAVLAEVTNSAYSEPLWKRIQEFTELYRQRYTVDSIKDMPAIQVPARPIRNVARTPAATVPRPRHCAGASCADFPCIRSIRWWT